MTRLLRANWGDRQVLATDFQWRRQVSPGPLLASLVPAGWRVRAAYAVGAAVAVNAGLLITKVSYNAVLVSLLVVTVMAVVGMVLDSIGLSRTAAWTMVGVSTADEDREDARLATYQRMIENHLNARYDDDTLHRRLLELAGQRLYLTRGLRLSDDASLAEDQLGADLATHLLRSPRRRLKPATISLLISRIEEL